MAREIRACEVCGANFSATEENEFCPVCMLRRALAGGVESGESFSEDAASSTPKAAAQRLEHYELVTDKEGQPMELGRGAMGVTYKAFDVDLRCPVTLKVISEKYLGDETGSTKICAGSACGCERASSKRRLRLPPWKEGTGFLLRDGVRGGGNSRQPHQALWTARSKARSGNYDASRRRFGCGAQEKAGSPGHQAKQYHGEL